MIGMANAMLFDIPKVVPMDESGSFTVKYYVPKNRYVSSGSMLLDKPSKNKNKS